MACGCSASASARPTALVAAGGVAANQAIRDALLDVALQNQVPLVVPPPALCTDNAAMIAWAGAERLAHGLRDPLDVAPAGALAARPGGQAGRRQPGRGRGRISRP